MRQAARRTYRIGLVSASYFDHHYGEESALQIVLSGLFGNLGLDFDITDDMVKRAKKLLIRVGLGEKIEQSYTSMSKGERESVLIARAFMNNPEILILDEPCSGLDIIAREKMLDSIKTFARQSDKTIIYVTHYAEEVPDCFGHALLLRNGRIYATGNRTEIFTKQCLCRFLDVDVEVQYDEHGKMRIFTSDEQITTDYKGVNLL